MVRQCGDNYVVWLIMMDSWYILIALGFRHGLVCTYLVHDLVWLVI